MRAEAIKQGTASIEFAQEPRPRDIVLHKSIKGWDPHVVTNHAVAMLDS